MTSPCLLGPSTNVTIFSGVVIEPAVLLLILLLDKMSCCHFFLEQFQELCWDWILVCFQPLFFSFKLGIFFLEIGKKGGYFGLGTGPNIGPCMVIGRKGFAEIVLELDFLSDFNHRFSVTQLYPILFISHLRSCL